jgi:phenylalanyl-tRNA synthetase beta chain
VDPTDKAFFPIVADEVRAGVSINGAHAGYIALLTGAALNRWGLEHPVAIAEVSLETVSGLYPAKGSAHALPSFPEIGRDVSLIVGERTAWHEIESVIDETSVELLVGHEFVGVFRGKQIGEGQKSVTVRFLFRHPERTLRHEEVDPQIEVLVGAIAGKTGATIRK